MQARTKISLLFLLQRILRHSHLHVARLDIEIILLVVVVQSSCDETVGDVQIHLQVHFLLHLFAANVHAFLEDIGQNFLKISCIRTSGLCNSNH